MSSCDHEVEKKIEVGLVSSSDYPEGRDKVCIIGNQSGCYYIYVVDLCANDNLGSNSTLKHPTFILATNRVDGGFDPETFCILGSTLYMFDGSTSVYAYTFPSNVSNIENFMLETYMLERIPDLHCGKNSPAAIATPDMKRILVFSSKGIEKSYRAIYDDDEGDFEMYYPGSGCWQKLRGIAYAENYRFLWQSGYTITSYNFKDNQSVMVFKMMNNRGSFSLDLNSPNQPCQVLPITPDDPQVDYSYNNCDIILLENKLHLTSHRAYDKEEDAYFDYPASEMEYRGGLITRLHVDDNECRFCVVQTGICLQRPVLTVNVYKLDLQEYKNVKRVKGKCQAEKGYNHIGILPATEVIKSFEFSLDPDDVDNEKGFWFSPHVLLYFQ